MLRSLPFVAAVVVVPGLSSVRGVDGMSGLELLLPFDTDDPQFMRGFEAGRLWEMLKAGEPFSQTIHASNAEMAIRMAEAQGYDFTGEELDETFVEVHFE